MGTQLEQTAGSSDSTAPAPTLEVVFIDTCLLSPELFRETRHITPSVTSNALFTIEAILKKSTATWLVVAGHYTVYSVAEHGDTPSLLSLLVPLLVKYKVHLYLNGHDHVLQHISWRGTEYITSGAGALTNGFPE
eukprot:gene31178-38525_t